MSDISLCYAFEDRQKAARLFTFLRNEGRLPVSMVMPGEVNLPAELRLFGASVKGAAVAVVLWSEAARASAFLGEMRRYTRPGSTIVVLLEQVEPPPAAERIGIVDLSGWDGAAELKADASDSPGGLSGAEARARSFRAGQPERAAPHWARQLNTLLLFIRHIMQESATRSAADSASANAAPNASPAITPEKKVGRRLARTSIAAQKRADAAGQPAAAPQPQPTHAGGRGFEGVFISYRRADAAAYARGLYDRLAARFGRGQVFLDVENIGWGEDFVEAITAAAESCSVMIALISRGWVRAADGHDGADDYVRLEVAKALGRRIRVIPILIQGATMPAAKELPEDLAPLLRRNALALTDTRWERDVEDLIKALEGLLKA